MSTATFLAPFPFRMFRPVHHNLNLEALWLRARVRRTGVLLMSLPVPPPTELHATQSLLRTRSCFVDKHPKCGPSFRMRICRIFHCVGNGQRYPDVNSRETAFYSPLQ